MYVMSWCRDFEIVPSLQYLSNILQHYHNYQNNNKNKRISSQHLYFKDGASQASPSLACGRWFMTSENYLEFSFVSLHSLWSDGRKRKCKEVQVGRLHKWKGTLTGAPVNCSQSEDPFYWICFLFSEEQFRKLLTITTEMQK